MLTQHQVKMLDWLRDGGHLIETINGWEDPRTRRRIRLDTQDALEATAQLAKVVRIGKRSKTTWIVHKQTI